jgi:hypothetical protein
LGDATVLAVSGQTAVGVAAIIAHVVLAALGGVGSEGRVMHREVGLVVDAGRTASANHTAATVAGTSVVPGAVGGAISGVVRVRAAAEGFSLRAKAHDAGLAREVIATLHAAGVLVVKVALGQPGARLAGGLAGEHDVLGHGGLHAVLASFVLRTGVVGGAAHTGVLVVLEVADAL